MPKETVLSIVNIIHIIRTRLNSVALWTLPQILRMLSLPDLLVVFLSYFDQTTAKHSDKKKKKIFILCALVMYSQQLSFVFEH